MRSPSGLRTGWLGTGAGWVFAAMALGWGGWSHVPEDLKPSLIDEAEEVAKAPAAGDNTSGKPKIVLTPEEQFFTDPRSVYVNWSFVEPDEAPALPVRGYAKPTPEQVATALIDGQKLLAPYAPQTAQGVIAVPVATADEPGVMLYDVKRRMLLDRRIFKLEQLPRTERSWYELERKKILYLGEAPDLSLEMWVDEPGVFQSTAASSPQTEEPAETP